MKFKDAYQRANDGVHVRDALKDRIAQQAAQDVSAVPQTRENRKRWLVAIPTALTAAAAVFLAVFVIRAGATKDAAPQAAEANLYVAAGAAEEEEPTETKTAQASLAAVDSYESLCERMRLNARSSAARYGYNTDMAIPIAVDEAVLETETAAVPNEPMPMPTDDAGTKGYSTTNNQVEGIDEADIVKTDGTWIYDLNTKTGKLYILSADGERTAIRTSEALAESNLDQMVQYREMILANDRLYVIATVYRWDTELYKDGTTTVTEVYELGDRSALTRVSTRKQDGDYQTARLVGDKLVIVSEYDVLYDVPDGGEPEPWCPAVAVDESKHTLTPDRIYINPHSVSNVFVVVTMIDTLSDAQTQNTCAVLGGCSAVYCNDTHLLIASYENEHIESDEQTDADGKHFVTLTDRSYTGLCLFDLTGDTPEPTESGRIEGRLLNQFSMDAYADTFRFVVTRRASVHTIHTDGIDTHEWHSDDDCALYVLDASLSNIGAIEGLAENEIVQSARFMGDVVYFVTFRQTDPLFAVDLSDPAHPQILSELKISGFSAYLHPFGDGRLLGIGYEADEKTGWTEGVKVSLYDISDPKNVREILRQSIQADYTNVAQNHKAVYVDAASGTVAFPAENRYFVCRVRDTGVELLGVIDAGDFAWDGAVRGLSVGDAFYVISPDAVTVLSFETMKQLATVPLN